MTKKLDSINPLGIAESLLLFGIPTVVLYLATHFGIPYLNQASGIPIIVCWFINGGALVFVPLFVFSLLFYKSEGRKLAWAPLSDRFRLKKMTLLDTVWGLGSIVVIGILTAIIMNVAKQIVPSFSAQPSFLEMDPLTDESLWILLAWLPLFIFNIIGEEFFWRGYIFPRQELVFGPRTWIVHGLLWMMFHVSFGLNLLLTLLPIIFITSYAVQKTKNTYVSILIHGLINGSGFLLVAFGLAK